MHIFRLVIADLFAFVRAAALGFFTVDQNSSTRAAFKSTTPSLLAPLPSAVLLSTSSLVEEEIENDALTFRSIRDILPPRPTEIPIEENASIIRRTMVVGRADEPLFARQVREYDGVITHLPYGALVSAGMAVQHWVEVTYKDYTGYIHRDALYEHLNETRPYFVIKEFCAATSLNTKRLRAVIHDEFSGGMLELPLQTEEYVAYRLFLTGVVLPTTAVRPRAAGSWQKIYRGLPGVKIGVRPKTNAVMEYYDAAGVGHVGYVEAVFPDESISLSEVGVPEEGFYNELTLTREAWMALQPVFIQF